MKNLTIALVAVWFAAAHADARDKIPDSVVKIYSTLREPNLFRPWSKESAHEVSGTGVIVDGNRILTNAHVVNYASQVFVQANQSTERVAAKVKIVAPEIDMAILEVADVKFFENRPKLPLAHSLPAMKQSVSVYGYPVGGEQLSITQGVVSRIEYSSVAHGGSAVRIQIDAAINPGNSGGPAVSDGNLIGLVFSKLSSGENIGYLFAAEEVKMFLDATAKGAYAGKPRLKERTATTENEALRARLGMKKEAGILVVEAGSDKPDYPLKRWDVILKIGNHEVDSQGNVKVLDDLRLNFQYLIPSLVHNDRVHMTIVRDKKTLEVDVPVVIQPDLVMPPLMTKYPRYFVYGPMVFTQVTQDLASRVAVAGTGVAYTSYYKSPLAPRLLDPPAFSGEEIVALTVLLPHRTSKGYSPPPVSVVTKVDGVAVKNLPHLVELLRDAHGEFLTVELVGPVEPLVFRRKELLEATEDILSDEAIRKQYSDDLDSVWHKVRK